MSLYGKWSNTYNKAAFQAKLYKNIDPDNAKITIAANDNTNCAMHKIITSVSYLPIYF